MKRFLLCLFLSTVGLAAIAQNKVDLTIKYNVVAARYEVYAISTFTSSAFLLGASQISVVLPSAVANSPLSISSIAGGVWTDNTQAYAPSSASSSDFHAVATTGAALPLTSGQETLLFTFTLSGGCVPGVRLFNNTSDPQSNSAGMNGGDYNNSVFGSGTFGDVYRTNTNNNGTTCTTCNLVAPTLSK